MSKKTTNRKELITELFAKIESEIASFNDFIPEQQRKIFERVQIKLKELLSTTNGKITNSVENWNAINAFVQEFQDLVKDKQYQSKVAEFATAFNAVADLQNRYFSAMVKDFSPAKVLDQVKKQSITDVVKRLTDAGIDANVSQGIRELLSRNISGGGNYNDLVAQMRDYILTNQTGPGALERYAKTYTTDALNGFSRQYSATITADLGLEWFEYLGSNIVTTRPWCLYMTKKRYVHKSELSTILHDHIDGVKICSAEIPCNKKTGLANGLKLGTNERSVLVDAGGWECGHQFYAITKEMVPANIRAKFEKGVKVEEVKKDDVWKARNEKVDMEQVDKYPTIFNLDIIDLLPSKINIDLDFESKDGSHFSQLTNTLRIVRSDAWKESPLKQEIVMYHELAHAIHVNADIIGGTGKVNPQFNKLWNKLKEVEDQRLIDIHNNIVRDAKLGFPNDFGYTYKEVNEFAGQIFDTIGALSGGKYGGGHDEEYYNTGHFPKAEVFAHAATIYYTDNRVWDKYAPELKSLMKEYFEKYVVNKLKKKNK